MIKNVLKKVVFASLLSSSMLMAESSTYQSLVGFEGGYGAISVENDASPAYRKALKLKHAGFKLGAQSDDYRVFISGRYYDGKDFDNMNTIGAEIQHMFNVSNDMNLFIGLNAGLASIKYIDRNDVTRTVSDPYFGGDAGANIHVNELVDLELGVRFVNLQLENTISNITYNFDDIFSGYASIIFKYQMD